VVVGNRIAVGIIGGSPLENDVAAIGLAAVRRVDWRFRRLWRL
jgi:hypothetical protein